MSTQGDTLSPSQCLRHQIPKTSVGYVVLADDDVKGFDVEMRTWLFEDIDNTYDFTLNYEVLQRTHLHTPVRTCAHMSSFQDSNVSSTSAGSGVF